MTLVAVAQFPRIINHNHQGGNQSLIIVSDSRVTNSYSKEYWDIAQKIHQLSSDAIMGYSGNVKFAEEVLKTLHFELSTKNMMFDGHEAFVGHISQVIKFKRERLGNINDQSYDSSFLLCIINDKNEPEVYQFSYIFPEKYSPIKMPMNQSLIVIGQSKRERDIYGDYVMEALIDLSVNDPQACSSAMDKAMHNYVERTTEFPDRKYVGGLIQGMILSPNPQGAEDLNRWVYDFNTQEQRLTKFDYERQRWVEYINNMKTGETTMYPLESIRLRKKVEL